MPANLSVYRAHVEAGAATNTAEHFPEIRIRQDSTAAVVDDDQVKRLRSVCSPRFCRAADVAHVAGHFLCCRAHGQKSEENCMVFEIGNDSFHAHECHMHPRQGRGHADVAFIGNGGDMPGLGTGKVASRDPHVRLKKLLAQRLPCRKRQRGRIIRIR